MTVIAWDGKTLAADKRMTAGSVIGTTTKIRRHGSALLAVCGDYSVGMEVMSWYQTGADPEKWPATNRDPSAGASLIVVHEDATVWKYESSPAPFQVEDLCFAWGSGAEGALVAMACGKSAEEAVLLVSRFNTGCGNGVDTLEL